MLNRQAQQFSNGGEDRFLILYHAAVRGYIHLAIGEGVECVDGLVGRATWCQLHFDTCFLGGEVIYFAHFDFSLLHGAHDGLDDLGGGSAEWNLGDDECAVVVGFLDFSTNTHCSSTFAIVVSADVDFASCREVRIELELFATQVG